MWVPKAREGPRESQKAPREYLFSSNVNLKSVLLFSFSYTFGNSQLFSTLPENNVLERVSRKLRLSLVVFWGRLGLPIPRRVPLLTVIGKPIPCPKTPSPSPELVNAYHEKYLQATRDIYETYRNTMGWCNRPLEFKRWFEVVPTVDPTLKRKSVRGKSLKIYLLFTNAWYPIFVW